MKSRLVGLALLLTLALAAGAAAETVELVILGMAHANNPEWNEAGVEAWKKANPQYKDVKVTIVNDGSTAKLTSMTVAGTPPDIIHRSSSTIPNLAYNGYLRDLTPFIQKDRTFNMASYIPATIETQKWKSGIYGLPRAWSAVGTMYNADLLGNRGISVPSNDWTWDEMLRLAKKATYDANGDGLTDYYGFTDTWTHNHRWPVWVWGTGGDLYDEALRVCTLDSDASIAGWEFYVSLFLEHGVAPKMISNRLVDSGVTTTQTGHNIYNDLFNRGHIAFHSNTRFSRPTSDLFQFGVLQLPKGPKGRTSVMVADYYGIHPDSKNADLAWELIKYLTSPAGYMVARDPSKVYYWALSPHVKQARETLINAPDLQAVNWVAVAEDARRPAVEHPAIGQINIDWNGIMSTTLSVRQAMQKAALETNNKLKEAWDKRPW